MKSIEEEIFTFIKSNGFKQIENDKSDFFGDYYNIFADGNIQLRFNRTKSQDEVDVKRNLSKEDWFDLALIKALVYNEKNLNVLTTFEMHCFFLQNELLKIVELFNKKNYKSTKRRLEELENERVKQMFPDIDDNG